MVKPIDAEVLAELQRRILEAQLIADAARAQEVALCLERAREATAAALLKLDRGDLVKPPNPFDLF